MHSFVGVSVVHIRRMGVRMSGFLMQVHVAVLACHRRNMGMIVVSVVVAVPVLVHTGFMPVQVAVLLKSG